MKALVRAAAQALVRLYYPKRTCEGLDRLGTGPVILAPNHPNALLDPLVLRLALGRPVAFLAKSTLFSNAFTRFVLAAFDAIPVYRQRDAEGGDRGGKNEETFARCRALLARGGALALFPEGTSHSDPTMKPLRTGAARIALSAEAERDFGLGLRIVPVGLFYESKSTFRSGAHVVLGEPIAVARFAARQREDDRAAATELTAELRRAMDDVVLQAETRELLEGATRLARALVEPAASQDELADQRAGAKRLLDGYRSAMTREPARTEALVERCRKYLETMTLLGIDDPWAIETPRVKKRAIFARALLLLATSPLAVAGAALGWVPYRLAGRLAARVTHEEDVLGTAKLLGGALLLAVAWSAEAVAVGVRFGPIAGASLVPIAAALGLVALLWDEALTDARGALRALVVRREPMAAERARTRAEIAGEIGALLE